MLRTVLLVICTLSGVPAHAELEKVFENIRGTTVFIDPTTVQINGNYRRIWELQSYREPGPRGVLSMKIHKEYDCKRDAARMLSYTMYKGKMGEGEQIGTVSNPGDWQDVSKNPGGKGGFRKVCQKD